MGLVRAFIIFTVLVGGLSVSETASANGQKRSGSATTPAIPLSTGRPVRQAFLKPVMTVPFQLPNGSRVNLAYDMTTLLRAALIQTGQFQLAGADEVPQPDECGQWTEIRATLAVVEFGLTEIGVNFGYSLSSGETGGISSVKADTKVKLGSLNFVFEVAQCSSRGCHGVDSMIVDQRLAGLELGFTVNFGQITTGANFITQTGFGKVLNKVFAEGAKKLAVSPRALKLNWKSLVKESNPESGVLTIGAGAQQGLKVGEAYEVLAITPSTDACSVFKTTAYIKTTRVDFLSSEAEVTQVFDGRGAQAGDVVTVRIVTP